MSRWNGGRGRLFIAAMHKYDQPFLGRDDAEAPPTRVGGVSLFFDFDGTLVDIAPVPDAVVVGASLIAALERLERRLPNRVAIVSGRSLAQLDALLGTFAQRVAIAGSHGAELRRPGAESRAARMPEELLEAVEELTRYADRNGLLIERKTLGAALHYRRTPDKEASAVAAATAIAIAARHGVTIQHGKMMVELRADGDKGRALTRLLDDPAMAGTRPLFFGDDVTDEDGFAAAAKAGGAGVLVGEPRATAARHRLGDVAAVARWIDAVAGEPAA